MAVAPARVCAYRVIRRVFEQDAYADRALNAEATGLDGRDRALAMAIAYGAVQRKLTLDHVAERFAERRMEKLDPPVIAALRLGLLQILYLDGIADHAAVNDSVELVKLAGQTGGAGLVNAVLRRAIREGQALIDGLTDASPAQASIKYSVPWWLAELWFRELGPDTARKLLRAINDPAENALRINTLRGAPAAIAAQIPVDTRPAGDDLPEGLIVEGAFDSWGSELFRTGAIMPQSRGSMLVSRMLDPQPGERVLDLCAAPGAKTTQLAALMQNRGTIHAVEVNAQRADGLRRTVARSGAGDCIEVLTADARSLEPDGGRYDRVLIDPPCSGLGTLQSRPDIRWRTNLERLTSVSGRQRAILTRGAALTKPGGMLVYSVCTISQGESEGVIDPFLAANPQWTQERIRATRPDLDGTDGFWFTALRRSE